MVQWIEENKVVVVGKKDERELGGTMKLWKFKL